MQRQNSTQTPRRKVTKPDRSPVGAKELLAAETQRRKGFEPTENGQVVKVVVYLALGITITGNKEVLGMWAANSEGAKFWLHVLTELKNRGVRDIFIGCVDGLKGFPEVMEAVFPATQVQLCLVYMVRQSLSYVGWKQRKEVAADLKQIYRAATEGEAEQALRDFEVKWDRQYPSISKSWRTHWPELITFLKYPQDIRKALYTTNAFRLCLAILQRFGLELSRLPW